MFDITKPKARVRQQRILVRLMGRLERRFARKLLVIFREQYAEVADVVEAGNLSPGVFEMLGQWQADFVQVYRTEYRRIALVFFERVLRAYEKLIGLRSVAAPETRGMASIFWSSFYSFIETNTAFKVTRVQDVTKEHLRRTVSKGVTAGLSVGEVAKAIRATQGFSKMRSKRIARTETHSVANFSTHKAVESTPLKHLTKEWVATIDERTRVAHASPTVNGQKRDMNQDFRVGGAPMAYPGDPRGGAANVIHCRCIAIYHTSKTAWKNIKTILGKRRFNIK